MPNWTRKRADDFTNPGTPTNAVGPGATGTPTTGLNGYTDWNGGVGAIVNGFADLHGDNTPDAWKRCDLTIPAGTVTTFSQRITVTIPPGAFTGSSRHAWFKLCGDGTSCYLLGVTFSSALMQIYELNGGSLREIGVDAPCPPYDPTHTYFLDGAYDATTQTFQFRLLDLSTTPNTLTDWTLTAANATATGTAHTTGGLMGLTAPEQSGSSASYQAANYYADQSGGAALTAAGLFLNGAPSATSAAFVAATVEGGVGAITGQLQIAPVIGGITGAFVDNGAPIGGLHFTATTLPPASNLAARVRFTDSVGATALSTAVLFTTAAGAGALNAGTLAAAAADSGITLTVSGLQGGDPPYRIDLYRALTAAASPDPADRVQTLTTANPSATWRDPAPGTSRVYYTAVVQDSDGVTAYSTPPGLIGADPTVPLAVSARLTGLPLCLLTIGDSITAGVGTTNPAADSLSAQLAQHLQTLLGTRAVTLYNGGISGHTTADYLPGGPDYQAARAGLQTLLTAQPDALPLVSLLLGTNDSAVTGPTGAPLSAGVYSRNLQQIVDQLLHDFPGVRVFLHFPPFYTPNTRNASTYLAAGLDRLTTYAPVLKTLASAYAATHPDQVYAGDDQAFDWFAANYPTAMLAETGPDGTFYLHPNTIGATRLAWLQALPIAAVLQDLVAMSSTTASPSETLFPVTLSGGSG